MGNNNVRLIAKLDVKGSYLVKGIKFEGLRRLGTPHDFARKYYEEGIDELIYIDIVASLYERNNLSNIVEESTRDIFVPITVGGGIRNINDVANLLEKGADKIAINTAAIKNPKLISDVAKKYGSQCMVLSVQAKRISPSQWEAYYDNGREKTGIDVVQWVQNAFNSGAGEILLTSVDQEGTMKGLDIDLVKTVSGIVPIPVIACGGLNDENNFVQAVNEGCADAVAVGSLLHYGKSSINIMKRAAIEAGIDVRRIY